MEKRILITNIQRFCLHDGPGIRTTVFMKGCSLQCPWCSNPENIYHFPQKYVKDGVEGIYGKWYEPNEVLDVILKDKAFYSGKSNNWYITKAEQINTLPGGATFSGGECLLQMPQMVPLLEKLKEFGIHTAVETCLFVPEENLVLALKYVDFFYVDMKILDDTKCKEVEKGNLDLYLRNLEELFNWTNEERLNKPVVIRIPVIGGYTDSRDNRSAVKELISKYNRQILKIELIKEHNLGEAKYKSLNKKMSYHGVSDELMNNYKSELGLCDVPIEICSI